MQQSTGKDVARDILYREWLPSVLTPLQIRSAAILLLLGDKPQEIPYLDAYGVRRTRIYSIENNHRTHNIQMNWNLGVNYVYDDLSTFLASHLQSESRFAFMNLDIEGTYRYNIDPSMTEVLLYCFRYPKTAVATYTTIGHDDDMLLEGLYSLVSLLWLAPHETEECVATLERRYMEAGYKHAFSMVLRDLFWIRSQIEHACLATLYQDHTPVALAKVRSLFHFQRAIWHILVLVEKTPLRFEILRRLVLALNEDIIGEHFALTDLMLEEGLPKIGIRMTNFRHLIYRGQHNWSQKCYFTMFEKDIESPISVRAWASEVLTSFVYSKLIAINQEGEKRECATRQDTMDDHAIVWNKEMSHIKFEPRKIPERFYTLMPEPAMVSGGKLTKFGREWVQTLANEGLTAADMRTVFGRELKDISDATLHRYVIAARKKRP